MMESEREGVFTLCVRSFERGMGDDIGTESAFQCHRDPLI